MVGFGDAIQGSLGKNGYFPDMFCFFSINSIAASSHVWTCQPSGFWDVGWRKVSSVGGTDGETPVVALIGGSSSSNTIPVASVAAVLKIPQAGYMLTINGVMSCSAPFLGEICNSKILHAKKLKSRRIRIFMIGKSYYNYIYIYIACEC